MTIGPSRPLDTGGAGEARDKFSAPWVLRPQPTHCGHAPARAGTMRGASRQTQRETRPWPALCPLD